LYGKLMTHPGVGACFTHLFPKPARLNHEFETCPYLDLLVWMINHPKIIILAIRLLDCLAMIIDIKEFIPLHFVLRESCDSSD
jgi:hypothetical protein